jgi:quercetin dioxygenase-like cupin family protein
MKTMNNHSHTSNSSRQLQGFSNRPSSENSRAIPGALFHFLVNGTQTGGSFSLIQIHVSRGSEPPAHTHAREDESYYIQEGAVRYKVGEKIIEVEAGDYIYLPKGISHQFEILTESARLLMWMSPAGLDQWFWDNSVPAPDMKPLPVPQGPPPGEAIEHFVTSLRAYGVEMD